MTRWEFLVAVEEILGVEKGKLKQNDSRETIPAWDSLADVKIFTVVGSELGVDPGRELIEAETVADIIHVLETQGAFGN
jgi:acyl carrier protein